MYHANVCANYYNRVKFADKLDDMTLTTVSHSIFMEADKHMIEEFQEPTEAMRMLRAKFRYPAKDPAPNAFKDTRTELEKLQSILRTTSQILEFCPKHSCCFFLCLALLYLEAWFLMWV